jgi:flagellar biosynthesis protein FlhG
MRILPASSGIQELTQLSYEQKIKIFSELDQVIDTVDYLLIDTAAGISSNVMDFNAAAHEIVVVVSPEPTSITDAYALMKVLSLKYAERCCRIIVNLVASAEEGAEVFRQLNMVTDRFLDIHISYLGSVVFDEKVTRSIKHQKIICESYPQTAACKCLYRLAEKISVSPPGEAPAGESHFFWNHLIPQQLV